MLAFLFVANGATESKMAINFNKIDFENAIRGLKDVEAKMVEDGVDEEYGSPLLAVRYAIMVLEDAEKEAR